MVLVQVMRKMFRASVMLPLSGTVATDQLSLVYYIIEMKIISANQPICLGYVYFELDTRNVYYNIEIVAVGL